MKRIERTNCLKGHEYTEENAKDFLRNNQVMMQEIEDAIRSRIAYGSAAVALGNDGEDMTPAGGEV